VREDDMVEATHFIRPPTSSTRDEHHGISVSFDYMRDDIRKNLPANMQQIDSTATTAA